MECTVYELKGQTQCSECASNAEQFHYSDKAITELVGKFVGSKPNGANCCSFKPWSEGHEAVVTMKFKCLPPNKSDIQEYITKRSSSKPDLAEDSSSLLEFSPEYSKNLTSMRKTPPKGDQTSSTSIAQDEPKKIAPSKDLEKTIDDNGVWCTNATVTKKTKKRTSPRKYNDQLIEKMKTKYRVTDYHRGYWVINSNCCGAAKVSGVWREVCKMIKCGQLPYCNAKYQKPNQEIWIYCNVISSCEVRKKLKTNHKLNITSHLSYYIHPHGAVLKL